MLFTSGDLSQRLDLAEMEQGVWGGTFDDAISQAGVPTYYSVNVVDGNGIKTIYSESGVYSFYPGNSSCP
jgi:hypothetical protein